MHQIAQEESEQLFERSFAIVSLLDAAENACFLLSALAHQTTTSFTAFCLRVLTKDYVLTYALPSRAALHAVPEGCPAFQTVCHTLYAVTPY